MLFTNPIWLFAMVAISIPVIIHLWNIKPGKTLKVGSIALFMASSSASSRSFKLLDILLLLLRCLLLMLLALLLAAPLWQQHLKSIASKGWVLLPQANFKETYQHFQPKIDSLTNAGYELHFFETGFGKQNISELKTKTDSTEKNDTLNYWLLVRQLAGKVTPATSIELFTPNTVSHFTGTKPLIPQHINWHTYTPADSVATWPARAWFMNNGNIRVLLGTSTPTGTTYQYRDISNRGNSNYKLSVNNGTLHLSFNKSTIIVDTTTFRVSIYSDNVNPDVNYLKAALSAVNQLTGRNKVVKLYNNAAAIPANQNWIYWLSEKPVDASVSSKTKNLFVYEPGKLTKTNSWISNTETYTLTQGQVKIPLYKFISSKKTLGTSLWTDAFGNIILGAERKLTFNSYHFYSRFNPTWNDLVWQDDFPKWLLALTQPVDDKTGINERRALTDVQLLPAYTVDKTAQLRTTYTDLSFYIWLLLVIIFVVERWLATKNKTALVNG